VIQDQETWAAEQAYLERVTRAIQAQLDMGIHAADNYRNDAIRLQQSMWQDVRLAPSSLFDLEDAAQINQIQMDLSNRAGIYKASHEKIPRLQRMRENPYFGRMDFLEQGEQAAEKLYIGIHTLIAEGTREILVYDWRAPVSGMFYDFEIGPARYSCPAGLIEGELLLKRQYSIQHSNIAYMFDSSLSINDAMLQELLGKSTDSRMKTIVTSIQKEQNTVIRNSRDQILMVEGPAGSGKTSIALHRAAYLLYKYRETLRSENILIFSPNHVFEEYISQVLPTLGEENIRRSTFMDFFGKGFLEGRLLEMPGQQMEYVLSVTGPADIRLGCMQFKASPLFLEVLKRYAASIQAGSALPCKDLVYNGSLLISEGDIRRLYQNQYDRLPYANRLEKVRGRLGRVLEEYEQKRLKSLPSKERDSQEEQRLRAEYQRVQNEIARITEFDVYALYTRLFEDILSFAPAADAAQAARYRGFAAHTLSELEQEVVNYEDFAPMVYLKAVLEAGNQAGSIQHIIMDEAQDYTPVQYEICKVVFKNRHMTILGDVNQTVNGYMNIGSFDIASAIVAPTGLNRIALTKSYRSSKELADFCKKLLSPPGRSEQLNRHGAKPKVVRVSSGGLYQRLAADMADLKNRGCQRIAVICKTAAECRAVFMAVRQSMEIGLVSNQNEAYEGDCLVIPSYLAKGLEFDAVLAPCIEDTNYSTPEDRKLLYTVCTRALHELTLYYSDTMPPFISGIDETLYTLVRG